MTQRNITSLSAEYPAKLKSQYLNVKSVDMRPEPQSYGALVKNSVSHLRVSFTVMRVSSGHGSFGCVPHCGEVFNHPVYGTKQSTGS